MEPIQTVIPENWLCSCNLSHAHFINNSWGSLRPYGYVGVCNCTCAFSISDCIEALEKGYARLSSDLVIQLIKHCGVVVEGFWKCASCEQVFSDDIDRLAHFSHKH